MAAWFSFSFLQLFSAIDPQSCLPWSMEIGHYGRLGGKSVDQHQSFLPWTAEAEDSELCASAVKMCPLILRCWQQYLAHLWCLRLLQGQWLGRVYCPISGCLLSAFVIRRSQECCFSASFCCFDFLQSVSLGTCSRFLLAHLGFALPQYSQLVSAFAFHSGWYATSRRITEYYKWACRFLLHEMSGWVGLVGNWSSHPYGIVAFLVSGWIILFTVAARNFLGSLAFILSDFTATHTLGLRCWSNPLNQDDPKLHSNYLHSTWSSQSSGFHQRQSFFYSVSSSARRFWWPERHFVRQVISSSYVEQLPPQIFVNCILLMQQALPQQSLMLQLVELVASHHIHISAQSKNAVW